MKKTSLCYIESNGCFLMMLRNRKKADPNEGKWIGVGGKFEPGENPEQCVRREVAEETGFKLKNLHFYGIIEFRSEDFEDEDMYLFSAEPVLNTGSTEGETSEGCAEAAEMCNALQGENGFPLPQCNEGELHWISKNDILKLNLWEGDRVFLKEMLQGKTEINMRLSYKGDRLVSVERKY